VQAKIEIAKQEPRAAATRFARATWLACAVVVGSGAVGWLWLRHWGRVPFSVPSQPWYHCFPFYVFPHPVVAWTWMPVALTIALLVAAGVILMGRRRIRWPVRLAASAAALFVLALAVAALGGGPRAWWAPFDYDGEYPAGVHLVGAIPLFLRRFATLVAVLPTHAQGHPPGAMIFYGLIARIRLGLRPPRSPPSPSARSAWSPRERSPATSWADAPAAWPWRCGP
jgi:hypothetical protein